MELSEFGELVRSSRFNRINANHNVWIVLTPVTQTTFCRRHTPIIEKRLGNWIAMRFNL